MTQQAEPSRSELPLPDYDHLPIGSVQSRIRSLDSDGLAVLAAYERNHANRLPVMTLIEARLEMIQAQGGDAFGEYSLPEAILKLRQGVGRLIRTRADKGIVVILDPRILTKQYGQAFLRALPKCRRRGNCSGRCRRSIEPGCPTSAACARRRSSRARR